MKRLRVFILVLGLLILSACSASDLSETAAPSESGDGRDRETRDLAASGSENHREGQEAAGTGQKPADTSDRDGKGGGSRPSAAPQQSEESAAVKRQENSSQSGEASQAPAASSEEKQDESATAAEEPEAPAEEPAAEPVEEPPAVTQPPTPEPASPEEPVQPPAEPEKPKTIYDYAFDAGAIRAELIAIGQSMGLTHITEDDGIPCTPDTCSWAAPVTASESFQGDSLKRALQDYVTSMPSVVASYGGAQMSSFTIYVQDNGGGSYTFYFLY